MTTSDNVDPFVPPPSQPVEVGPPVAQSSAEPARPVRPYPPTPPTSNTLAITSLALGIVSIPVGIFSILDLVLLVPAFACAVVALRRSKQSGTGRGLAIGGLVAAAIGTAVMVVVTAVAIVVFSDEHSCANHYGRGTESYYNCVNK
ncbi:hypothetical protein SAMN05444157_0137 [Frankineae bacterium MT45]|nr:hypothetical protein SAMN05444157_0137 [Frankineae bacterium MT45]